MARVKRPPMINGIRQEQKVKKHTKRDVDHHSVPPPHDGIQKASEKALATYDILENILPHLHCLDIIPCRAINKTFRFVIDTSLSVRSKLGFDLTTLDEAKKIDQHEYRGIRLASSLEEENYMDIFHPLRFGSIFTKRPQAWTYDYILHGGPVLSSYKNAWRIRYTYAHRQTVATHDPSTLAELVIAMPDRWRLLWAGTPKTKTFRLRAVSPVGLDLEDHDFTIPGGVTIGDMNDALLEMLSKRVGHQDGNYTHIEVDMWTDVEGNDLKQPEFK